MPITKASLACPAPLNQYYANLSEKKREAFCKKADWMSQDYLELKLLHADPLKRPLTSRENMVRLCNATGWQVTWSQMVDHFINSWKCAAEEL